MTEPGRRRQQAHLPGGRRGMLHKVRVTPDQERVLAAKADRHGWTIARLLAESALAGSAEEAAAVRELVGELMDLQLALGAVGNNLNQIARATNATLEWHPETLAVLKDVDAERDRIRALVDRLQAL